MTLYNNVPGLWGVMLCSGVELVRGVVEDRRGVAGTIQLGCGNERDGRRERERGGGGRERVYLVNNNNIVMIGSDVPCSACTPLP